MRRLTLHDRYLIAKMRLLAWLAKYDRNTAHRIGLVGIMSAMYTTDSKGREIPLLLKQGIDHVYAGTHPQQRNRSAAAD